LKSNAEQAWKWHFHRAGQISIEADFADSHHHGSGLDSDYFSSGLGATSQQRPWWSGNGGLLFGTLTALYFVPLAYWFFCAKSKLKTS